jgi:predicted nucleic acid-binding protein
VNRAGILVDTGPLVALLNRNDGHHERAKALMAACAAPLRTCEPVVAEACYLLSREDGAAAGDVLALGRTGAFDIVFALRDHWAAVERILRKYRELPAGLADACLIHCAEVCQERRILTFDTDFHVYRWGRNRVFQVVS